MLKINFFKKRLAFQEENLSRPTAVAERIHAALRKANGGFHLSLGKNWTEVKDGLLQSKH